MQEYKIIHASIKQSRNGYQITMSLGLQVQLKELDNIGKKLNQRF